MLDATGIAVGLPQTGGGTTTRCLRATPARWKATAPALRNGGVRWNVMAVWRATERTR